MRHNPHHASEDPGVVRALVHEHPWTTIVSNGPGGLVASHYPVLLDDTEELVALTHVGRPDETVHGFDGRRESLLVFQGRHGYVSPSWYAPGSSRAPTWNFTAVHAHGVPEVLDDRENLAVLTRLVAHFEQHVDEPMYLDQDWGARAAQGTVGLRIPISRFTAKVKLSQDKDEQSVQNVIDELRTDGPYSHPGLADDMERARGRDV
ncbi:FMN-binding negative transcriptional regulator [Aeromicrobium sp. CTD01-1L150]|uniref:FMN-binding negative transcriptional regulator n=1 Tax=Aeromicrobium sp. CTD01-1L150 TaxID=3341830 RepID=UPI0035C1D634